MINAAGMGKEGKELSALSNADLAGEIEFRAGAYQKWQDIYWEGLLDEFMDKYAGTYKSVPSPGKA